MSLLEHYIKLAFQGAEDAKLESAKVFFKFSEQNDSKLGLLVEAVDALIHLMTTEDNTEIVKYSLMTFINICKEKKYIPSIRDTSCFKGLARTLCNHNMNIQLLAIKCVGLLARHPACGKTFATDGALLPMLFLLKPEQDTDLIIEVCKALSVAQMRGDCAARIVEVWGLEKLGQLIEQYIHANHEKAVSVVSHVTEVFANFSSFPKIAICMMNTEKLRLVELLHILLGSHGVSVVAKRAAAKTCLNIINNENINGQVMLNREFIIFIMQRHSEKDFLIRHTLAKTLDNAITQYSEEAVQKIIEENMDVGFIEWMIKSNGCDRIQVMVLKLFISRKWICADRSHLFSSTFVPSLVQTIKETISTSVKRMCDEALYHFSGMDRFKKEIVDARGGEILIPALTFKDVISKYWCVRTLARIIRSKEFALQFVKQFSVVRPAVNCFLMTHPQSTDPVEDFIFISTLSILSNISETREFRVYFVQSGGINKLLDILEDPNTVPMKMIQCLIIVISYVNSANKESSGNANLKLVPEKKLCKVVENITSRNFSLSAKVIELISAYSQHSNSPIHNFWNILYNKCLNLVRCNEDYNSYLYQRITCFTTLTSILTKDYVWFNLDLNMIALHYLTIFINSNLLSHLKRISAKGLCMIGEKSPSTLSALLPSYCRKLQLTHKDHVFTEKTNFSDCSSFCQFLQRFLQFFEMEKQKKLRKYMLFSRIQRFLTFLLHFVREKKENEQIVEKLIRQASENWEDEQARRKRMLQNPMLHYRPKIHNHHYDTGQKNNSITNNNSTSCLNEFIPYQPTSTDSRIRLAEFISRREYAPIHSQHIHSQGKDSKKEDTTDLFKKLGGSGTFANTVVYNKKIHKKQKLIMDQQNNNKPTSLLDQWEEEYSSKIPKRPASASVISRNAITTTAALMKKPQRKVVEDLDPELVRKYLKRSEHMGIVKTNTLPKPKIVSHYRYR
ncbi:hypothetical protein C9374_001675 [Naegleria lovaniensis]|uniref:Uncharacterized protein n=1 Tax=Naegleria lovaniensis TaxID=51637 RepID=A0AA88GX73_NAELO|nr:uncharacterized protein C9374_001675 [Naegleria lovaniensis]KAG2387343.1 hypothetical protein C9374_001675 [Naegleria lovaniensis]